MGVYADEAKTGTKDNREQFQRLLADCKAGKIDLILTKSVSRFSRNTLTLLETIRELKEIGVAVRFEEQNIDTSTSDGELMLSILASFAEAESKSASENQKWRVKRNFESGKPWRYFMLGYRNINGKMTVVREEAEIVKMIFQDYLAGYGSTAIMNRLNEEGIVTQRGFQFHRSAIDRILRNYTYTGNMILQTKFRENHLTKKTRANKGELPQYHVKDSHEGIIPLEVFEAVQVEIKRRKEKYAPKKSATAYPFSGKIQCALCSKNYRRKTTVSNVIWICSTYNTKGKAACPSKAIPEITLLRVARSVAKLVDIKAITAAPRNELIFELEDGSTIKRQWLDRSRSESWTEEMRETARAKSLERK